MKKIGIIIFLLIVICISIFLVAKKDSKDISSKNTNNVINKNQNVIIDEKDGIYTVIINNEVKYSGTDVVQAEIYSKDPEFDLRMPNFDNLE